ncbi:MAG TPA: phasin family protein [Beijerinckiaceae bacterium]|nr:phasin family protein [Beijerinckiaceae bacterium]
MAKRSNARSKLKARTAGGRTPTQRAPVQRRRDKGTRAKATQLKQNVLNARIESERSRNGRSEPARDGGMSRNGQANIAALDHTEASAPMNSAFSNSAFSTLSRSKYIFGHFYEVSRAQLTLAQMSAQQLQKSLSALITCRSPMEFFQLQNQLVKEQLELLTASLYAQFLKPMSQQSELPQGSL